jgi:hypothetical protein
MVNYVISLLKQVIIFSTFRNYKNLSRINPAVISTGIGSSNYFHPVGGGAPYIFTSLILVSSCHLDEPKTSSTGRTLKLVEGACIEGEYERLVGCIGQIIHLREFKGQIAGGNISFTTAFATAQNSMLFYVAFICFMSLYQLWCTTASSPSSSTLGRRVSVASSFSRGPGGHGSSGVLSCYDIGESYLIIIIHFIVG